MKLTLKQLSHLLEKYGHELEIKFFYDFEINNQHSFLSKDLILPSHVKMLSDNNINEVEVYYNPVLYEYLVKEFPVDFRKPYNKLNFTEMDRLLEGLNSANMQSRRKRYIRMIGDAYCIDGNTGRQIILLKHNELVDYRKWNNLKRDVDRNQIFSHGNSEVAIIIFVNLALGDQKMYIEHFKVNTDLISIIVTRSQEPVHCIAPDFLPTEDVISVNDHSLLLEEYIRTNARLIIIGEKLDDNDKRALLQVRNYDKFVRLLVVPVLDHRDINDFLRQVKLVYNSERWL